jgi:hypothetical protein
MAMVSSHSFLWLFPNLSLLLMYIYTRIPINIKCESTNEEGNARMGTTAYPHLADSDETGTADVLSFHF